jgi:hypothetical protein
MLELWFDMQLLRTTGHAPNLQSDAAGNKLENAGKYIFSFDDMAFARAANGPHSANLIKLMRLSYAAKEPGLLEQVKGAEKLIPEALRLTRTMLQRFVRV